MPTRSPQIEHTFTESTSQSAAPLPVAWMRRRLRTTMWLAGVLIGVQTLSALPSEKRSPEAISVSEKINPSSSSRSTQRSPNAPRSIPPTGWRRTVEGWQHVSTWAVTAKRIPLSQRVVAQRDAQPVWLRRAMDTIRQIPPGSFAFAQIASVGLLFWLVNRKKISVVDQTCHALGQ